MQKRSDRFLDKEIEKFRDPKYIEGLTFKQLKKLSLEGSGIQLN